MSRRCQRCTGAISPYPRLNRVPVNASVDVTDARGPTLDISYAVLQHQLQLWSRFPSHRLPALRGHRLCGPGRPGWSPTQVYPAREALDEFFQGYEAEIKLFCPDFRPDSTYNRVSTTRR